MFTFYRALSVLCILLITFLILFSTGCHRCCPRVTSQPASLRSNEIVQEFPAEGATKTAWKVSWAHGTGKGLYITGAWFKRTLDEDWMRVLWDARVADIFVPYHTGSPRFYDLTGFRFNLVPATSADAGCCGTIIDDVIVKEVRDRGVAWKDDDQVRRGQELVLWATLDAANYNYIMQYGFRDDGTIEFRIAGTARNLPGREFEAHMHNALWRIDIDLNGYSNDSVLRTRHIELGGDLNASDNTAAFNGGVEGFADWVDTQFTELRVIDTATRNSHDRNIGYDLRTLRRGTARHLEDFTHHDFWATRYHGSELYYTQLPTYVSNTESISNTDVVLWHITPVHHIPRDEDGEFEDGLWKGVALVMWGGFDLRPRNLFDNTPLHPAD